MNSAALRRKVIRYGAEVYLCPRVIKGPMYLSKYTGTCGREEIQTFMTPLDTGTQVAIVPNLMERGHLNSTDGACSSFTMRKVVKITRCVECFGPVQCTVVVTSISKYVIEINVLQACSSSQKGQIGYAKLVRFTG